MTYYQFSTSDIRSIGVAQWGALFCASIGTWALTNYLDFSKDITLAKNAGQDVPDFLDKFTAITFSAWIIFWVAAVVAFIWQDSELQRIKKEHGESSRTEKLKIWCKKWRRANISASKKPANPAS